MKKQGNLKQLPNRGNNKCFGCSPYNPSGLQMKFFVNENSVFSSITVPEHLCGWNKLVHGGVVSTILDEIMSWSAIYLLKKITVTKSMTIDFIKPIFICRELKAVGKVLEIGKKREAKMEGLIYNKDEELCAKSTGAVALLTPGIAKRLGIMDDNDLMGFEPFLS